MKKLFLNLSMAAVFSAATMPALHAATITETFGFANMTTYAQESGTSFAAFNPALGTLNSVSYSISLTDTINPPALQGQGGDILLQFEGPNGAVFNDAVIGTSPVTFSGSFTPASLVSFGTFVGPGTVTTSLIVQPDQGPTGNGVTTIFQTGTVAYNYTPAAAAAAPEASSVGLVGFGLAALGVMRKRSTGLRG